MGSGVVTDAPTPRGPLRPTKVTIAIPAKDEEDAIAATIRSLPLSTLRTMGLTTEVVVIDGSKNDRTAELARGLGARILHDPGQGKGFAWRMSMPFIDSDLLVMIDADGTYAPDAIPRLIGPLLRDNADVVMGMRRVTSSSMSLLHRIGNLALSSAASLLYGQVCPDLCTGLWAFRTEHLKRMPLRAQGFELEAELFATSTRLGLRLAHVPVDYLPRRGETKLSTTRDGLRIGSCLLASRWRVFPQPELVASAASAQETAPARTVRPRPPAPAIG